MKPKLQPELDPASPGFNRREFLRLVGLAAGGVALSNSTIYAGPTGASELAQLIPPEKKLNPHWIKSLFDRGQPQIFRGEALDKIGFPIGGICAGGLYLSGDGRLWLWDIFNKNQKGIDPKGAKFQGKHLDPADGAAYVSPPSAASPLQQGFALRVTTGSNTQTRELNRAGWTDISFVGQYPIARVEYRDAAAPVTVDLEAFSPFIPLNADESGLPATILNFTIRNPGKLAARVELTGWLENAICLHTLPRFDLKRVNRVKRGPGFTFLECAADPNEAKTQAPPRPDILFEDFEKETYAGWTVEGSAFGKGPALRTSIPAYQGNVGGEGRRVVNSHSTAPGGEMHAKDDATGKLTSKPFTIERDFISFYIGGGNREGETCLNLLIDGEIVRTCTGPRANEMIRQRLDVRQFAGRQARLEIVDHAKGSWGNIGLDQIVFTDSGEDRQVIEQLHDYGNMGLALLDGEGLTTATTSLAAGSPANAAFAAGNNQSDTVRMLNETLIGALTRKILLAPGAETTVSFIVSWHFPNLQLGLPGDASGRFSARLFTDSFFAARHVVRNFTRLSRETRLWRDTWYDSSLPHWFLDRTFANTTTLATTTCHRFGTGRFYAWEGVGCCNGTCTHVWHYAQALARIFPELERDTRERVDFGSSLNPATGEIGRRGELGRAPAVDGQAGRILGALREHQMSPDDIFLRRNWANIKRATEWLIARDANADGLLHGAQDNTLDAAWFGEISWLSSLYLAALRAAEEMAREMGDDNFAAKCRDIFTAGQATLAQHLYNGEYFIQRRDPARMNAIGTYDCCHIDQVMGQSWAWQVGLGRVLDADKTLSALRALWKYNFAPDIGPWRAAMKSGRWYALPGEAGLVMTTNPRGVSEPFGDAKAWQAGYFNECMSGFEHQVASHMIAEGMVMEGLAITRAIHDRYTLKGRNPWNEIECSDHYARAMASYGTFISACGFEGHGPKAHLGFAPRLTPENFRAAFTAAEGWGTFSQQASDGKFSAHIELKWGRLWLKTLALVAPAQTQPSSAQVTLAGRSLENSIKVTGSRLWLTLATPVEISAGQTFAVVFS